MLKNNKFFKGSYSRLLILSILFFNCLFCSSLVWANETTCDWDLICEKGFGNLNNFSAFSAVEYNDSLYVGTHNISEGCEIWRFDGPGTSDWTKVSLNGFGNSQNQVPYSMAVYQDNIYVGARNNSANGFEIWLYNGAAWTFVTNALGIGDGNLKNPCAMMVFDGKLILGTGNSWTDNKAKIFSFDGTTNWAQINTDSFGDSKNRQCRSLCEYDGKLYAGTYNTQTGGQVWRYDGPVPGDWTVIATNGFNVGADNQDTRSLCVYAGKLYAGTVNTDTGCQIWEYDGSSWSRNDPGTNLYFDSVRVMVATGADLFVGTGNALGDGGNDPGGQVWRYTGGTSWNQINENGFDTNKNMAVQFLLMRGKDLYAGTANTWGMGSAVWRTRIVLYDWELICEKGFGNLNNSSAFSAEEYKNSLYVGTQNITEGCEIWRGDAVISSYWAKVSSNGFGNSQNQIPYSMAVYQNNIYVGARNNSANGFEIWSYNGAGWSFVTNALGIGDGDLKNPCAMLVFDGKLILGTGNSWTDNKAKIFSFDGTNWEQINTDSFGNSKNRQCRSLCEYDGKLYAGTYNTQTGGQVWRYDGPAAGDWTVIGTNGFNVGLDNQDTRSLCVYAGKLYAGTVNTDTGCQIWEYDGSSWNRNDPGTNLYFDSVRTMVTAGTNLFVGTGNALGDGGDDPGGQVWRYTGGTNWIQINENGFDTNKNMAVQFLFTMDGYLYAGTANSWGMGSAVWRTPVENAGTLYEWELFCEKGFGNLNNFSAFSAVEYKDSLYVGTHNITEGCEIWRSCVVISSYWAKVSLSGFGNSQNQIPYSMAAFQDNLYVGTRNNSANGFEIWSYDGAVWTFITNALGIGDGDLKNPSAMLVFDGKLILGTGNSWTDNKAKIFSFDGTIWEQINTDSFGNSKNRQCRSLCEYDGKLYAGTYNTQAGGQVWRYDGPATGDWTAIATNGFNVGADNQDARSLCAYDGKLFAGTVNTDTGCQIWEYDGSSWSRNDPGTNLYFDSVRTMVTAGTNLFVGTGNALGDGGNDPGGQVWRYTGGTNWIQINENGFDTNLNMAVQFLLTMDECLYAGTANNWSMGSAVWRTWIGNFPPLIFADALLFPSAGSIIHASQWTNIIWNIEKISDDIDGTNLTISKIDLYYADTTNFIVQVTNNIANTLGEIEWYVPPGNWDGKTNYVLKFEVVNSLSLTNSRIFWDNKFALVPEPFLFIIYNLLIIIYYRKVLN